MVDAPASDPRLFRYLEARGLQLSGVFITHAHYDHTDGLEMLLSTRSVPVYAAASLPGLAGTVNVKTEHEISLGALTGRVVETPGHTPDSISLVLPGVVFTGDALFAGSVGGTAGDRDRQREITSVREHILSLPEDWLVCPGHGPSSTVGVEWRFNPFFNPPRK